MAKQLGIQKGEFFDKNSSSSMAVKLASAEALIISQTKQWLKDNCQLDFDSVERNKCKRSVTILLIKNIAATVKDTELREIFERYGSLVRLLISPFNTLAIVEYNQASQAEAAMRNLAYYKINYLTPIYLEYAPVGTLQPIESSDSEMVEAGDDVQDRQQRQIFVKNLNFDTREEQLETIFKDANIPFKTIKIIRRSDTQQSRGYGFIEVESKELAEKAVKKL
jgi:multiple RNA-binding domain-containing protein 1